MRYLVNSQEMKQLDTYSIETMGVPSMVLMERAAWSCVEEIRKRFAPGIRVLVLCGSGNNGADGLAMARMLSLQGDAVEISIAGDPTHGTGEWNQQLSICRKMDLPMDLYGDCPPNMEDYDVIVDAMLGTGLSRPVSGIYARCIDMVNESPAYIVSVDIPSGISADTGAVLEHAVRADLTVTFQYQKLGTVLYPGAEYAGETVVAEIGILPQGLRVICPMCMTADPSENVELPARIPSSNKGTYGKALIVAGSRNMAGAALLAGEAAYRMGTGLVRILTPECNRVIIQTGLPEAIMTTYCEHDPEAEIVRDACEWASAIVVGPGLGTSEASAKLLRMVLQLSQVPVVIDADGLNLLAADPTLRDLLRKNMILTPHMGEMARLSGRKISEIKADPAGHLRDFVSEFGCIVVQKDARTMVLGPEAEMTYVNITGNSGMSTGGSGDVLSGIIGSLLAQKSDPLKAAIAGVFCHGRAGDLAAQKKGERAILARDLIEAL